MAGVKFNSTAPFTKMHWFPMEALPDAEVPVHVVIKFFPEGSEIYFGRAIRCEYSGWYAFTGSSLPFPPIAWRPVTEELLLPFTVEEAIFWRRAFIENERGFSTVGVLGRTH